MENRAVNHQQTVTDPAARFFSVDEAERMLPLVQRIVYDIVEAYPRWQRRIQEFDRLSRETDVTVSREQLEKLRHAIDDDAERINRFVAELHDLGCHFKGFEEGLVDFYSLRDGRTVCLCWRLGEERIRFWHEVDAGFAGRQPLDPLP